MTHSIRITVAALDLLFIVAEYGPQPVLLTAAVLLGLLAARVDDPASG